MRTLEGKVVIVTGANGALGSLVTKEFLRAGAQVAGVSRAIEDREFDHPQFMALPADLLNGDTARRLADAVLKRFGQIDILAHVMGGYAGGQSVEATDDATFEKMLDLNYRAAFYMMRAVVPAMRERGGGRIVAVASRQALEPAAKTGAYSASKAALVALVKAIAIESKDCGISANTVLPGTMATPGNTGSELVHPGQVAAMIVHLASDAAAQVTGAAIPIYGSQV